MCHAAGAAELGQDQSGGQGTKEAWAGTFDDNRPGCSKQDQIVKVFMLIMAVGVCSD